MSKKVIQSGKAGVFSDQLLTRLMVIFLHRHRFTVKVSSLHALSLSFPLILLFFVLFISSPFDCCTCCCSTSFLFFHANSVFFGSFSSLATKCSCFEFIQIKQPIFFRAPFLAVSWYNFHHTHMHKLINYITSNYQFNSFIRILQ